MISKKLFEKLKPGDILFDSYCYRKHSMLLILVKEESINQYVGFFTMIKGKNCCSENSISLNLALRYKDVERCVFLDTTSNICKDCITSMVCNIYSNGCILDCLKNKGVFNDFNI